MNEIEGRGEEKERERPARNESITRLASFDCKLGILVLAK